MIKIADKISKKKGHEKIVEILSNEFSLSELNTVLLEIFERKIKQITPSDILKNYTSNKFVGPSKIDHIPLLELELSLLKLAKEQNYHSLELSPVSPLGACSVVGTVSQNKIISSTRGTEVLSDATNVLALESSKRRKEQKFDTNWVRLCTTHRHIRAQAYNTPGLSQHFKLFSLTTAGRDTGNFLFEKNSMLDHLLFYEKYIIQKVDCEGVIYLKSLNKSDEENDLFNNIFDFLHDKLTKFKLVKTTAEQEQEQYYKSLQFKIMLIVNDEEVEIADGGFVDWTQKLTGNRKERLLTSALGIERLYTNLLTRLTAFCAGLVGLVGIMPRDFSHLEGGLVL